jgi:potassium-transporting ATPase KdpC subunit
MNRLPVIVRQHIAAFRILIVFTIICGVIYPAVVLGISQVAFHNQANGSLVSYNGKVVGSSLLCQEFVDAKGNPLPQWFQPRPSDAIVSGEKGDYGCDPLYSSASNLGPNNPTEVANIKAMQKLISTMDNVPVSEIPADAVTASGSGLDPDISPQNANIQAARVAAARHLPLSTVMDLIAKNTKGRDLGILGEPAVNVLTLNLALAGLPGQSAYNASGS